MMGLFPQGCGAARFDIQSTDRPGSNGILRPPGIRCFRAFSFFGLKIGYFFVAISVGVTPGLHRRETLLRWQHLSRPAEILKTLKLNSRRRVFYSLRRTFATVGGATLDQIAVNAIMGHAPPSDDMASIYRQRIDDSRLVAVSDYIRAWLWPKELAVNEAASPETVE